LPDAQGHGPDPLRGQRRREGGWRRVHGPDTVHIGTRRWRHTWPRAQRPGLVCRHDEVYLVRFSYKNNILLTSIIIIIIIIIIQKWALT